jgi:hypothetical protein
MHIDLSNLSGCVYEKGHSLSGLAEVPSLI